MIKKCNQNDEEKILSYIGDNYPSCLYLFLNLKKYGVNSEKTKVFIQYSRKEIVSVLLIYYSCLHVYSKNNSFNVKELTHFFEENGLTMIYCTEVTAKRIYSNLPESLASYSTIETGSVAQIRKIDAQPLGLSVTAEDNDYEQIAGLIYNDEDIGKSYNYSELAAQLKERAREGYARNMVIKQNGLVIAHACTNAEMENIAIVAELIVREEYRRKGYAAEIWRDICGKLLSEGKEVFSFYYSEASRNLHNNIGFIKVCDWAKIVITERNKNVCCEHKGRLEC